MKIALLGDIAFFGKHSITNNKKAVFQLMHFELKKRGKRKRIEESAAEELRTNRLSQSA